VTKVIKDENALKVLFVGNSITLHAPKPEIGWNGNWGMAASKKEYDYVHRVVEGLEETFGPVNYCIAQGAAWERDYPRGKAILEQYYKDARDYQADVVIIRIGENIPNSTLQEVDCKTHFEEMIRFFASNPSAKVIVTDNFWRREMLDNVLQEIAEENDYLFCQLHDLQDDEKTMAIGQFEHKGVSIHPSDYGMECIAKRILKLL
jgi:hypothetical protein